MSRGQMLKANDDFSAGVAYGFSLRGVCDVLTVVREARRSRSGVFVSGLIWALTC